VAAKPKKNLEYTTQERKKERKKNQKPTSRGFDWVCHKLGNAPVLRSGIGSWVEGWEDGIVTERPKKKGKRYLHCMPRKSRPHEPILLLLVFNSVQL